MRLAAAALLLAVACAQPQAERIRPVAVVAPAITPSPVPTAEPTAVPTAAPTRRPRPVVRPSVVAPVGSGTLFSGLGGWIDVYDRTNDPASITPALEDMARNGVRTLYLETARFDSPVAILHPRTIAHAVEKSHALGMKVVAWYPPQFVDIEHDLEFSIAAINYRTPGGQAFDGFAPDIERMDVKPEQERTARLNQYSTRLRQAAGAEYPMAAIVIAWSSPYYRSAWSTFPWAELKKDYSAVMPMAYHTGRSADPATARELTTFNTVEIAKLSGLPVHVIGGVADRFDAAQTEAYVTAAIESGSIGGGLYDYRTQADKPQLWEILRRLNR